MVNAVIFDLDGTIVDSFNAYLSAYNDVVREDFGVDIPADVFRRLFGKKGTVIFRDYFEEAGLSSPDIDYESLTVRKNMAFIGKYVEGVKLLPGVLRLLEDLKADDVRLALASNSTGPNVLRTLEATGLEGFFEVVLSSDDVDMPKPSPQMYLKAASLLGVLPQECAVVEDTVHGIMAGKNAQMKTLAVLTGGAGREELEALSPNNLVENLDAIDAKFLESL
jgi:HAD superfamily hydrolase (TIGR01509 family)